MRVAVLGAASSWYVRDLQRAAGMRGDVVEPIPFSQIGAYVGCAEGYPSGCFSKHRDWSEFDCLLVRTMPPGSLEQVVFRMDALGQWERQGRPVLNPPRAIEVAVDKYLALCRLHAAGLRVPRTTVCQTVDDAMAAFETLGRDVVIKPLFGSEGRGMTRVTDADLALRAFKTLEQLNAVIYVQRFVPHGGFDDRLLVIGDKVLGMRRCHSHDWRTNISCGATAEPLDPTEEQISLAREAVRAVGAPLAGVDLLPGVDGETYVLEVNAVPGWKAMAKTTGCDVAALVLEFLESTLRGEVSMQSVTSPGLL